MNEYIGDYCKNFIEDHQNPEFSLFLKGDWGVGKTYFIKNFRDDYYKNNKKTKKKIVYISLYGINNKIDLDIKMFSVFHPLLASKPAQGISTLLRLGLQAKANIDINDFLKIIIMKDIKYSDKLKNVVLIVDDFERTDLKVSEIFGYFSEYIIDHNAKVIFVGNESKAASRNEEYSAIKEKTIGLEFLIEPDCKNAINFFLDNLQIGNGLENSEKIEMTVKNECEEIISMLNCKNLRLIRQSLYNLNLLLHNIEKEFAEEHQNIVIKLFIALFIQKGLNKITKKNQIQDAIKAIEDFKLDYESYLKVKEEKQIYFSHIYHYVPVLDCWGDIIFDGNYSKEFVCNKYKSEINAIKARENVKTLFYLVDSWRDMSKDKFKKYIDLVDSEFNTGIYLHPGEILHYYNILSIFSEWQILDKTKDQILETVYCVIDKYKEKIEPMNDFDMLTSGYAGYAFENGSEHFTKLRKRLKEISQERYYKNAQNNLLSEIDGLPDNINNFYKNIIHVNGTNRYYGQPLLALIDISMLFNKMMNIPASDQVLVISALEERYGKKYSNGTVYKEYFPDFENLNRLYELYKDNIGDILFDPIAFQRKQIADSLKELIDYFKQSMDSQAPKETVLVSP